MCTTHHARRGAPGSFIWSDNSRKCTLVIHLESMVTPISRTSRTQHQAAPSFMRGDQVIGSTFKLFLDAVSRANINTTDFSFSLALHL
eukprot:m.239537 g.239537  ORF g.239537 m.239537 type:complete len:88 (-) comp15817_c0_seq18:2371-2634(-)